jgi:signal transduction histidine kinase
LWILLSREKVWATWCEVFMELLRAYLKQTKIFLIAFVFAVAASAAVVCLYQLPAEAVIYMAVLWLGAGAAAFLYGYVRYRQKAQALCLVEKAPEINLDRLDATTDEVELLYREIIRKLDGMRMEVETDRHRSLEEMTDYYTMWAHQIKTPIFALRLLLQEEPERNRESLAQLFRIEQYVEMVLGYLRTEDMSADLKLARSSLDRIIREQIHKYAGIFVAKKLSLSYEGTDATVLTDEKWLGFVIGQILSNALKYTRTGGIEIWLEDERGNRTSNTAPAILVIADTGIGIQAEDLPRIFEKGYTGVNGREDNRATGIGLYLSRKILKKLGHEITVDSQVDKGTEVRLSLWKKELDMY